MLRTRRRQTLSGREALLLFGACLAGLIIVGALVFANLRGSSVLGGGGSFYSAWTAIRALVIQGGDPYSPESATRAQVILYGRPSEMGENPLWFDLPLFLMPVFIPFALIPDPRIARALWMLILELGVAATAIACMDLAEWRPRPLIRVLVGELVILSFPSLASIWASAPSSLLPALFVAILYCLKTDRDELSGALAVLCLFKWEVGLPFLALVLIRVLRERRWRALAGFGMGLSILAAVAYLTRPGWYLPFLTAVVAMLRSPHGFSVPGILLRWWPEAGGRMATALMIVVLAAMIYETVAGQNKGDRRFFWTAAFVLAATPLLGWRLELHDLAITIPALVTTASAALGRGRAGSWPGLLLLAAGFVGPWYLAWQWLSASRPLIEALLAAFIPATGVLGLYWTRWWFLRPGRTWMDEVRQRES